MTAPEERPGSDDQWAFADWIADGYAVPEDQPRRTTPAYDVDDLCQCDHRFGDHYKAEADWPVRCAHRACGCIRYRYLSPREETYALREDRTRDAMSTGTEED